MSNLAARADAADKKRPRAASDPSHRRRWGVALVGALLVAAGALWLVLPRTPGDGSAEVGFTRDLLAHDTTVLALLSELDLDQPEPEAGALLVEIRELFAVQDQQAVDLLENWDQAATTTRTPMSWMGHIVEGTTPGALSHAAVTEMQALDDGDRALQLMTELIGHLRGAVLMSRGVIGLSDHDQARDLAAAVIEGRNQVLDDIEAWFVARDQLPPTWLPRMTTDPGNLDHGDPVTSAGDVGANALRWLPVAIGVSLVVGAATTRPGSASGMLVSLGSTAGATAGLGHLAVAGAHADDAVVNGVFFVVAGLAQIGVATSAAVRPSPRILNGAATLAGVLTVTYVAFRILPPPGSVGPADIDLAGAAIVGMQLIVIAVWALRPLGGDLGAWGADALADVAVRGASAGVVVLVTGLAGVVGYVVGEADSRPPSQTDVGFAQDMIAHHGQAVQMAQLVDGRLGDSTVETVAREVVIFQQYENGVFDARLREWGQSRSSDATMEWMGMEMPLEEMPGIASDAQMSMLRAAEGAELDQMFLTLLGAHHVGGVQMAAFAAENADDSGIAELAAVIARNQRLEINEFSLLMEKLGYREAPGSIPSDELAAIARLMGST